MPHSVLYFLLLILWVIFFINFIIAPFTFWCVGLGRDLDGFSLRFPQNRLLCFLLVCVLCSHKLNNTDCLKLVCYGSAASCNKRLFLRILGVKNPGQVLQTVAGPCTGSFSHHENMWPRRKGFLSAPFHNSCAPIHEGSSPNCLTTPKVLVP